MAWYWWLVIGWVLCGLLALVGSSILLFLNQTASQVTIWDGRPVK
jgi:hypothetical protein